MYSRCMEGFCGKNRPLASLERSNSEIRPGGGKWLGASCPDGALSRPGSSPKWVPLSRAPLLFTILTVMKLHNERVIHFCQDVSLHLRPDAVPDCGQKNEGFPGPGSRAHDTESETLA